MKIITNYTTLYHTYVLLYYKRHIQITYNHTNIKVERKQYSKQGKKIELNKMTNCTTLYIPAIICKRHIQITYNHTNIKVERKQYSKQGKKY